MRVLLYDNTQGYLTFFWWLGRFLARWDAVISASSWDDAIDQLAKVPGPIKELQFWGHGLSGQPMINGEALGHKDERFAVACRFKRVTEPVIWWRACCTFARGRGIQWALDMCNLTGAAQVGHTRVISWPWPIFQSGGYGLKPGQTVYWDPYGDLDRDGNELGSNPFAKNTCSTFRMTVPQKFWR